MDAQRELAGAREELRPAVDVHVVAVLERRREAVEEAARHPHGNGGGAVQVLQRPERVGPARLPPELRHLALHPHVGEAVDPAREPLVEGCDGVDVAVAVTRRNGTLRRCHERRS